ncbi:MAG: hypothetical protein GY820_13365 [Gammaproteobacteria bacterium]|nr:hypothetical protein [Gammaproteobacteria bacterium]
MYAVKNRVIPLLFGGCFLGLHPAVIESVAWISGRFDLALTTFLLLALLCDIKSGKSIKPFAVGICFFLAALCKEMAVGFALALPLWHFILHSPRINFTRGTLNQFVSSTEFFTYLSIFVFGLLYLGIRYFSLGYFYIGNGTTYDGGILAKILLTSKSLGLYLRMLVFPFYNLSPVHYQVRPMPVNDLMAWTVIVCTLLLLSLNFIVRFTRKLTLLFVTIIASLFPVLHIIPMTIADNIVHERFLLFPIALGALTAIVLYLKSPISLTKKFKYTSVGFIGALIVINGLSTHVTIPLWQNDLSLWSWAIQSDPKSINARANYAAALSNNSQYQKALSFIDPILASHKRPEFFHIKGTALHNMKRYSEAEATFLESLNYSMPMELYAIALGKIAFAQLMQDNLKDIEYLLNKSLEITPYAHVTHLRYYSYYLKIGNSEAALNSINQAIKYASLKSQRDYYIQLKTELLEQNNDMANGN